MTQAQYSAGYGTANIYTSTDDGATWVDSGQTILAHARWVEFGGELIAVGATGTTLVVVAADGTLSTRTLAFTLNIADVEASVIQANAAGDALYATGTTGIWYSRDGETWTLIWDLMAGMTPWAWADQEKLLVSGDRGANAAVYAGPLLPTLPQLGMTKIGDLELAAHTADADAHHTWPLTEPDIPAAIARDSEVTEAISTHTADADAHHTWPLLDSDIPTAIARGSALLQVLDTCSPFVVTDANGWPLFDAVGELVHAYSDEVLVDDAGDALISGDYGFVIGG